jgi:hypothetical protein
MSFDLPQSTTFRAHLKVFLSSDHITEATGKTVAVTISKNGGAFGNPSAGATNATEVANGWYYVDLSGTDTNTLGELIVRGTSASCDIAERKDRVVNSLNAGFGGVPAVAAGSNGGLPLVGTQIPNATAAAAGGLGTVDANNAIKVQSGTGANQISLSSGLVTLASVTHTGARIPNVTLADTLTTYTGNTPQTGDLYGARPTNFSLLSIDANGRLTLVPSQIQIKKNVAFPNFGFFMTLAGAAVTGLTVTARRRIDGGSLSACANSATEVGSGLYTIDLTAADLNGNHIDLVFTASGADPRHVPLVMQP